MTELDEMDRHSIATVQRAIKKTRKARFPALLGGERVVYCIRCLRGSNEVQWLAYEPFFSICDGCIRDLAIFMEHSLERQRHTQTQSGPDENEGAKDRSAISDE